VIRRFELHRDVDHTGVSGTGVVAEGTQFSDGTCALRWRSENASTAVWADIAHLVQVHGHGGATRVVFLDGE
jgi:hypothetical protein